MPIAKADLLKMIEALPDDAVFAIVDTEFGGSDEIVAIRRAVECQSYRFNVPNAAGINPSLYVLDTCEQP